MSIMDKESFLKYLNTNNLTDILYEYCLEKGKKTADITQFIIAVRTIDPFGSLLNNCVNDAVKYYKDKFSITSVIDETGKIIINY